MKQSVAQTFCIQRIYLVVQVFSAIFGNLKWRMQNSSRQLSDLNRTNDNIPAPPDHQELN